MRESYRELVRGGLSGPEATERLLAEWVETIADPDDGPVFWLALAATQSKCGRLEPLVAERALAIIGSGVDLARWSDSPSRKARQRHLETLARVLQGPQPQEKRLRRAPSRVHPKSTLTASTGTAGAVVEFDVDERLGYAIATVYHPDYGHVVHVLQGTYAERPDVLESLVQREVLVIACFPLDAARRRNIVRVIGEVPLGATIPWSPVFRTRLNMKLGDDWSLWDGHTQTYFGELTEQQAREIPVLQVVNDMFIVQVLRTETVPARPNVFGLRES